MGPFTLRRFSLRRVLGDDGVPEAAKVGSRTDVAQVRERAGAAEGVSLLSSVGKSVPAFKKKKKQRQKRMHLCDECVKRTTNKKESD